MQKSRFFDAYKNKRPFLSHAKFKNSSGVYFIRSKRSGKIVYVGSSGGSLYKTIYRHFQQWVDIDAKNKQFDRTTYSKTGYEVCILVTRTAEQAQRVEKYFIIKLQPSGNPIKYDSIQLSLFDKNKIEADVKNADFLPIAAIQEEAPF
jgi:GIY-YIG catalytic domain